MKVRSSIHVLIRKDVPMMNWGVSFLLLHMKLMWGSWLSTIMYVSLGVSVLYNSWVTSVLCAIGIREASRKIQKSIMTVAEVQDKLFRDSKLPDLSSGEGITHCVNEHEWLESYICFMSLWKTLKVQTYLKWACLCLADLFAEMHCGMQRINLDSML